MPASPALSLRRLSVTHVQGDEMFADDVMLAGRLLLRTPELEVIAPCSDITALLTDLASGREVPTATLLLRPVARRVSGEDVVSLEACAPGEDGTLQVVGSAGLPAGEFAVLLQRLAAEAREYCVDRGEQLLVDDLSHLALS